MTDSSIDDSGEGDFEFGPSIDDLFGDIEDEGEVDESLAAAMESPSSDSATVDQTASDIMHRAAISGRI
ncbi:MAG: hypothetical protein U5K37_03730 [Natrialbaceae archaeon]|nr:hypothetical protein [Natrialbaceae archaeon]